MYRPLALLLTTAMTLSSADLPTITVTPTVEHTIDPRLFGGFLERPTFSAEKGPEAVCDEQGRLPEAVVRRLADLAMPVVRFPGGTAIDYDDWTDLISNAPGRSTPGRPITAGHQGGTYTNRFGLDEYLALQERLGFQPLLVANLRDALYRRKSLAEAAAHAAGMLAYCARRAGDPAPGLTDWGAIRAANGRPTPTRIPLVAVGNETWFFWPPKPAERAALGLADDAAVVARHVEALIAYADALKAVDPTVELIADGLHDPWNPENRAANVLRLKALLDPQVRARYRYVTIHQYFPMGTWNRRLLGAEVPAEALSDEQVWYGLQGGPGLFDDQGRNTAFGGWYDPLVAAGYRIAATEWNWNGWDLQKLGKRPFTEALPAALGTATYVHGLVRQAATTDLGCQSMMVGTNWGITAVRVLPGQEPFFMPQGHVMAFYAQARGDRQLRLKEQRLPAVPQPVQLAGWYPAQACLALVDAVAVADDRQVHLWIAHRQREAGLTLRLAFEPGTIQPGATATIRHLTGDLTAKMQATEVLQETRRTQATDAQGLLIDLPPASVTTISLPR